MTLSITWKSAILGLLAGIVGLYGQGAPPPAEPPAPRSDSSCPANARRATFELKDSGEIVEGSACIVVQLNGLRYSSELGRAITFTAGPNLTAVFASAEDAGAGKAASADEIVKQLAALSNLWNALQSRNEQATARVNTAANALRNLVSQSDDIFRSNGAEGVLHAAGDPNLRNVMNDAANATWAASDKIQISLRALQTAVVSRLLSNPSEAEKTTLTEIQTQITSVLTDLAPSTVNGEKTAALQKQKAIVEYWNRIIRGLTRTSFQKSTYVSCGITLNQSKQIAVRLYTADRLVSFDSEPVTLTDAKDPFVTVNCPSPFAVSAGVQLRFLKTSTFGIVPAGAAGDKQFGITEDQKTIPMPIAMVHVRLAGDRSHRVSVLGSVGVAAHSQGSGTAGSGAEYLAGFSLGLFRTMFVTAGLHFGKVSALNGGYKVGDAVPEGVTTVPVTGSYKTGFGLAITFTKP